MFSHVMVGATNIEESRKFYDAIMPTLIKKWYTIDSAQVLKKVKKMGGGKPGVPHKLKGIMRYLYFHKGNIFIITEPINGEDAAHGNGSTLGFQADSPEIVNAWHKAGLDNGGTAIEDPPGIRGQGDLSFYLAYLADPSGNKICAMHNIQA